MLQKDKILHFVISALIVLILAPFIKIAPAILIAAAVGLGKEVIWDYVLGKGTPDLADLLADIFGILAGAILAQFIFF